ncbi:MAG: DUF4329 domain-containing protein [Deltaproteobacteria bacterium]|nr:DUF4329 domain-containing protein [Deltaproteobacteria bacterium]
MTTLRAARFSSRLAFAASLVCSALVAGRAEALREQEPVLEPREFANLGGVLDHAKRRWHARSLAEDREVLGGIFESLRAPARFMYSAALGARGADEIRVRLRVPAGFRLAAIWHTHGADGLGRAWFSARDVAMAETTRVPVYLLAPSGDARVYRPGDAIASAAEARAEGLGWSEGIARGDAVQLAEGSDEIALAASARAAVERCAQSPS